MVAGTKKRRESLGEGMPVSDPGSRADAVAFLRVAAELLQRHGAPTHRIEEAVVDCAHDLGLELEVFATPTAIQLAFGGPAEPRSCLIRADSGETELARLVAFERTIAAVARGELDAGRGRARLLDEAAQPLPHGRVSLLLAHGLSAGAAAQFFSGSALDVLAATLLGLSIGALARLSTQHIALARLFAPLAAFVAALASLLGARVIPGLDEAIVTLSGLIVLLPGLSITVAMSELATRHLVSGTARLMGGLTMLLTLAFGVALAHRLAQLSVPGPLLELSTGWLEPLPAWTRVLALLVAPLGFCVLFQARWRDLPAIALVGVVGAELARLAGTSFGPEVGAFVGAGVVGLAANLHARRFALPSAVIVLPALLLLVPGSIGFRSMTAFLAGQPTAGIEAAFHMTLVAVALVAGLLVSQGGRRRS